MDHLFIVKVRVQWLACLHRDWIPLSIDKPIYVLFQDQDAEIKGSFIIEKSTA